MIYTYLTQVIEPGIKKNNNNNLKIFYCLNNDKRIRHKYFNLVLPSPYTYNIQYDKHYYYIISLKFSHEDIKQKKCSNEAECNNGILLKYKKKENWDRDSSTCC